MNTKRIPRIVVGAVLLLAAVAAVWYFVVRPAGSVAAAWSSLVNPGAPSSTALTASGTVETTEISIAPEAPGKILAVDVQEGDTVQAGQELFHLDDTVLKDQRVIAAASLETAQLALLQLTSPAALANAQRIVAQDKQDVDNAQASLNNQLYYTTNEAAIQNAQAGLVLAQNNLDHAQKVYANTGGDPNTSSRKALAYQDLYAAQLAYNSASYTYNLWNGTPNQEQIDLKRAALALARAKLTEDETLVTVLTGGAMPEDATGTGIMQLRQAQISVRVAQANLNLLDDQIAKMTVKAPVDGVVMTRTAEPGSVVNAGAVLLTLGRLDELTITVYVPEDRIGEVKLGQTADVSVDSFPEATFNARVDYISDQAEFTPRNVQTVSGRKNTVFAVKLTLDDSSGRLKPGMPADVTFNLK